MCAQSLNRDVVKLTRHANHSIEVFRRLSYTQGDGIEGEIDNPMS